MRIIAAPQKFERGIIMSASKAIKDRLADLNMTQIELANAMGTTRQNLTNKMTRDSFTAKELNKIGKILDFKVVLRAEKDYIIEYDENTSEQHVRIQENGNGY